MRGRVTAAALIGVALAVLPSKSTAQSPDAPTGALVVDRVVAAYGGRQAVSSVRAFRLEGVLDAHPRKQRGVFVRIPEGSDRFKLLVRYPTASEYRVLVRGEGFSGSSPETMAPTAGPLHGALRLQAARSFVPWILMELQNRLIVVDQGGANVVLRGELLPGLTLTFVIDSDTDRVIRSESTVQVGGAAIAFSTDYSDFRDVGGVLFAFHEETHASGVHTASVSVLSVEVNPVGDALRLPAGSG